MAREPQYRVCILCGNPLPNCDSGDDQQACCLGNHIGERDFGCSEIPKAPYKKKKVSEIKRIEYIYTLSHPED